ncbi:hypothetical protein [Amorphus orientalis]|uniref:Uncharacterized protein n=1 Tax=Amorphus orientalis TaxID=649198 RepID=A0AAE4AUU5_9HYPH|nr:hypothetical protein [Amorphus orientalis]MDQ0317833.1 hypothetical protein [Amorphus orientalis]
MHKLGALAAIVLFGLTQTAAAAEIDGNWSALSNTATSITGDITVSEGEVTFSDNKSVKIEPVGTKEGDWTDFGGSMEGHIFKLETPADPELLNGNKLCGMPGNPVTHLVLATGDDGGLSLIVYTGDETPTPTSSPCSIFNYAR